MPDHKDGTHIHKGAVISSSTPSSGSTYTVQDGLLWVDNSGTPVLKARISGAWTTIGTGVGGSGTANKLAKFTAGTTLGNALIEDDGTYLSVNKTGQTNATLHIKGHSSSKPALIVEEQGAATPCLHLWAESAGLKFYNGNGSQMVGQMGRGNSAEFALEAVVADLVLAAGGSGGDVVISTGNATKKIIIKPENASGIEVDKNTTAGNTRLLVFDVDNNQLERVSVGSADSAGSGYKVLRIPN